MPFVTLRPAESADVPAVLRFWQTAAEDAHRPPDTARALRALIAHDPGALILARDEPGEMAGRLGAVRGDRAAATADPAGLADPAGPTGQPGIIGTVIAGWDGWRCHLYRLAVAPTRRGQGIGRLLVSAAERRFQEFGASRVDAMVLDGNSAAHGAWLACGYAVQSEWSRWVKPLSPA